MLLILLRTQAETRELAELLSEIVIVIIWAAILSLLAAIGAINKQLGYSNAVGISLLVTGLSGIFISFIFGYIVGTIFMVPIAVVLLIVFLCLSTNKTHQYTSIQPTVQVNKSSTIDEVHKASLLYKDGHISKDEFDKIKLANGFSIEAKERTEEDKKESAAMWQVIYEQNRKREQTNQYIVIAVAVALFIAIVIYANT